MLSSGRHRPARTAFAGALVVAGFAVAACGGDGNKAGANGKVTVDYEDNAIKPEDRQAVSAIRNPVCSSRSPTG